MQPAGGVPVHLALGERDGAVQTHIMDCEHLLLGPHDGDRNALHLEPSGDALLSVARRVP
jgi:hypothetical protein